MMEKRLIHTLWVVSILTIIPVVSCTRALKEQTFQTPQAQTNLLIAGDASEFKDMLRHTIIQTYRTKANIRVVNIDKLSQISPQDYDAILIIDTCLAWTRFNPSVRSFLERPAAKERVVWFMTVDDTEEHYQHHGVDAITAASVTTHQQEVATRLTRQLDAILSKQE